MKTVSPCLLSVLSLLLCACDAPTEGFKSGDPSAGSPTGGSSQEQETVSKAEFDALLARVTALETSLTALNADTSLAITSLDQRLDAEETATTGVSERLVQVEALPSRLAEVVAKVDANTVQLADHSELLGALSTAANTLPELQSSVAGLLEKTRYMALGLDLAGLPTMYFSGVNLHLRNGKDDDSSDGTGNLILGHNRYNHRGVLDRTGSHNLIIGNGHSYRSNGNLLVGENHTVAAGGRSNLLVGDNHTVGAKGHGNVLLGISNAVNGNTNSVLGGHSNSIGGSFSTILGGSNNSLSGWRSTHLGGSTRSSTASDTIVPLWDSGVPKT